MNNGQEKFLNFILERVDAENIEKAKELLNESFAKQADGTFNKAYMIGFMPRMLELIKPEFVEEIKNIMLNYNK